MKRLLIANRGEIATRILTTARELDLHTVAVYTKDDANHAFYADEGIVLQSPADFTDIPKLVQIAVEAKVDAVHPGYGFLSESPEFAAALSQKDIEFIGPRPEVLRQTGDKIAARKLAVSSGVPVLPATSYATSRLEDVRRFAAQTGYPLMIKAVDGGGGRGIRLVRSSDSLEDSFKRACGESPSGQVFVEKAAVDGFRHVEVQVLGDRHGNVTHLWERECSIQRRFQKIIEIAPSTITDRSLVERVIESALKMARAIHYTSLGTFEFLVHESRPEYYFLEVNPRLQVEHTISEEIAGVDLVRCQLLLAQGAVIGELGLPDTSAPPCHHAMQFRITAEDPAKNFTLSMGRVTAVGQPSGPGVRFDSHLSTKKHTTIGSSYDSLLAKLILRAPSFEEARKKAVRALRDTTITGVTTNLGLLLTIADSPAFQQRGCSTRWLEDNLGSILADADTIWADGSMALRQSRLTLPAAESTNSSTAGLGAVGVLFRKGDGFKMELTEPGRANDKSAKREEYLLRVDRVIMNDFPKQFTADMTFSTSENSHSYSVNLTSTTQTSVASSRHRQASAADSTHIALPFPGQFMELSVDEGDAVKEGDVLCVVRQMKMELEVRAPYSGVVKWVCEIEEGETVNDGVLVCELTPSTDSQRRPVSVFKL